MPIKIKLKEGQRFFVSSDPHYGHKNLCRGVTEWTGPKADSAVRDFDTLDQMNATIVDGINSVVGQDDFFLCLGDLSFGGFEKIAEFRARIVCRNMIVMHGNHDHHIENNRDGIQNEFLMTFYGYRQFDVSYPGGSKMSADQKPVTIRFIASHFPMACWDHLGKGMIHIHGHHHFAPGNRFMPGRAMDVGVDGNNFIPYDIKDVHRMLKARPIVTLMQNDHHIENT